MCTEQKFFASALSALLFAWEGLKKTSRMMELSLISLEAVICKLHSLCYVMELLEVYGAGYFPFGDDINYSKIFLDNLRSFFASATQNFACVLPRAASTSHQVRSRSDPFGRTKAVCEYLS